MYDYIISDCSLNSNEKIILSKIISLNENFNKCFITNEVLSELLGINVKTIQRCINSLENKNYITRQIIYKKHRHFRVMIPKEKKIQIESSKERKKIELIDYDWLNED